jgi:hypothetical protein
MKNAKVKDAISDGRKARQERTKLDQDWVLEKLYQIAQRCGSDNPAVAVRAVELIGKHHGMFTDRLEDFTGEMLVSDLNAAETEEDGVFYAFTDSWYVDPAGTIG